MDRRRAVAARYLPIATQPTVVSMVFSRASQMVKPSVETEVAEVFTACGDPVLGFVSTVGDVLN